MNKTETMPQTFMEEYEDAERQQYTEAKEAYHEYKQSKVKTTTYE